MKKHALLGLSLLSLAGCAGLNTGGSKATVSDISRIQFTLPPQVQWTTAKQDADMTVFIPKVKGLTAETSPITIVYRRAGVNNAAQLGSKIVQSLSASCYKALNSPGRSVSKYANKAHFESVCNRVKTKNKKVKIGRYSAAAIFGGAKVSHLLLAEVRTPATAEPGKFAPKTKAEKKVMKNTAAQIAAIQKMMTEALACDAGGKCQ